MACIRDRELGEVKGRNRHSKILYANFFTTVTRWSSITSANSCIISFNSSFSFSGSFSGYDLIKLHWWPQSAFQRLGVFGGIKRIVLVSYGLVYCTSGSWWSWWFCNLPSLLLLYFIRVTSISNQSTLAIEKNDSLQSSGRPPHYSTSLYII